MCRVILITLVAVFFAASAYAQTVDAVKQRGVLRICSEYGYPPFEAEDENGEIAGFDIDISRAFADSLGAGYDVMNVAFDELVPALYSDKCDMVFSGMTITTERKKAADFSDPYYSGGLALVVNNKHKGRINSFRDINSPSVTVVVQAGVTAEDVVKTFFKKANLRALEEDYETITQEVIDGRTDVFMFDLPFLEVYYPHYSSQAYLLRDTFTYEPFGAAVRTGSDLRVEFNKFLEDIRQNGMYAEIYKKWFN